MLASNGYSLKEVINPLDSHAWSPCFVAYAKSRLTESSSAEGLHQTPQRRGYCDKRLQSRGLEEEGRAGSDTVESCWPSDFDLTTQGALFEGLLYFLDRSGALFAPLVFSSIKIAS